MPNKNRKAEESRFSYGQLLMAYRVATNYYLHRNEDGSLRKQRAAAEEMNITPPRFSEFLNIAWEAGMIDVIIYPPKSVSADMGAIEEMQTKLLEKLQKISPALVDESGQVLRKHKLVRVHIVPNAAIKLSAPGSGEIEETMEYGSVAARICKRAAKEFFILLEESYKELAKSNQETLNCGIGWSRTCERVVNLMPVSSGMFSGLKVCPLVGLIGSQQTSIDANFLAFRLASKLSGTCIKLSCPSIQPLDMHIETLRPISRALEDIRQCTVGISGIGVPYDKEDPRQTQLLVRKVITQEQLERINELGAVAEIHCHYFDKNGDVIPFEELGFKPVGIQLDEMKRMPRFMIVATPDKRKISPIIVAVKAGICSDLVLDHTMAHHILSEEYAGKLEG